MKRTTWEALTADQRRDYADPDRRCHVAGCPEPAGTPWGAYWCADHDDERIHRISSQFDAIMKRAKQ